MDQSPDTLAAIGQALRLKREEQRVSLETASIATRIKQYYLEAIESGHFELLPSAAQSKGFVRAYASYLGIDPEPLLASLGSAPLPLPVIPPLPELQTGTPDGTAVNSAEAAAIFTEIGQTLRRQRDLLSLSLEDVERHTHLRDHYIKAMEAGDFHRLPSPVQGRGMVSNYATFLGLNPDQMLLRYADALQAQLQARQAAQLEAERAAKKATRPRQTEPEARPRRAMRFLSVDALVAVLLVLFLGAFVVWGGLRIANMRASQAEATVTVTAPSIADVLLGEPTATLPAPLIQPSAVISGTLELPDAGEPIAGVTPGGTPTLGGPLASSGAPVQVYVIVRQRAWMRVIVDGEVAFDDRILPGSAYQYDADEYVEILTGSGAALQVYYNQADQGLLGNLGQLVQRIYTIEGVMTPTPAATATPPATPTSVTPVVTGSPIP